MLTTDQKKLINRWAKATNQGSLDSLLTHRKQVLLREATEWARKLPVDPSGTADDLALLLVKTDAIEVDEAEAAAEVE